MKHHVKHILIYLPVLFTLGFFSFANNIVLASSISTVNATVQLSVCGNGIKENKEQCDLVNLGGAVCSDLGFSGGILGCSFSCEYDTSSCSTGASADAYTVLPPTADRTYILPDGLYSIDLFLPQDFYVGDLSLFLFSHNSSDFSLTRPAPVGENFVGKLYDLVFANEDGQIVHNLDKTSTITLSYNQIDLNTVDEDTLAPYRSETGSSLWTAIPGYTKDESNKTITFYTDEFSFFTIFGSPISVVNPGGGGGGGNSHAKKVSPEEKAKILKIADFNEDGRIDIADLSILLYYHGKTGVAISHYDLNSDGKIDLIDISIMLYYWDVT